MPAPVEFEGAQRREESAQRAFEEMCLRQQQRVADGGASQAQRGCFGGNRNVLVVEAPPR